MSQTIPIDQLALAVTARLKEYAKVTDKILQEATDKAGTDGRKLLRQESPKDTGVYAKSWTFSPNQTKRDPHAYKRVLHAKKPHYRLTHLLEEGHNLKRNGRVYGHVRAIRHIAPVDRIVQDELEDLILEGIRKASQ